jgi:regulator of cell morphogenesis and NO signaling
MIDSHHTVAQIVLDHSECAEVFQRHRIDYCCHGEVSIEAAAAARKVSADALLAELTAAIEARQGARAAPNALDPRSLSTPRLVAHIIATHHEYLRRTLPTVRQLAAKVRRVHGDKNPKLHELDEAVEALSAALLPHLDQEEDSIFPTLTAKAVDREAAKRELAAMVEDHLAVATLLERVRAASDEFTLPDWACNSYRTLFSELEQIEKDVFTHVHLENHVLCPRFEREAPTGGADAP